MNQRFTRHLLAYAVGITGILTLSSAQAQEKIEVDHVDLAQFPQVRLKGMLRRIYPLDLRKAEPAAGEAKPGFVVRETAGGRTEDGRIVRAELDATLRIVLVIDATRSVKPAEFEKSLKTAEAVVEKMEPGDSTSIVRINGKPSLVLEFSRDPSRIKDALSTIKRTGMETRIYDALYSAIKTAREAQGPQGRGAVVLFTDGADEGSALSDSDCLTLSNLSRDLDVPVVTVLGEKPRQKERFQRISSGSGGRVLSLKDAKGGEVPALLRSIVNPRFDLTYESKAGSMLLTGGGVEGSLMWSGGRTNAPETKFSYSLPIEHWFRARLTTLEWGSAGVAALILVLLLLLVFGIGFLIVRMLRPSSATSPQASSTPPGLPATSPQTELPPDENLLISADGAAPIESTDLSPENKDDPEGLLEYAASGFATGREAARFVRDYSYTMLQNALKGAARYAEASLSLRRDGKEKKRYDLFLESTTIGTGRYAHIRIEDSTATAVHARIKRVDGAWILYDMMSGRGIQWNNRKLLRPRALTDGDEIVIGHTRFQFAGKS